MNTTTIKIAHNIVFESSMAYARGIVIQAPVYDTIHVYRNYLGEHFDGEYVPKYLR